LDASDKIARPDIGVQTLQNELNPVGITCVSNEDNRPGQDQPQKP
jgi:hypothetical protein